MASFVQDMGINHGCANVFVPQQFVNRPDVMPGFKQRGDGLRAMILYK